MTDQWKWSDKSTIAGAAGITRQHLNEILQRRCGVTDRELAGKLEQAACAAGYVIPWSAWMLNKQTDNAYFAKKAEVA